MEEEKSLEELIERFNNDEQAFIKTEALKILYATRDEKTALKALELLERAAQPF